MTRYRIYLLSPADKIYGFREARCETDVDALEAARLLLTEASGVEIWEDERRVARLPAEALIASRVPAQPFV